MVIPSPPSPPKKKQGWEQEEGCKETSFSFDTLLYCLDFLVEGGYIYVCFKARAGTQ